MNAQEKLQAIQNRDNSYDGKFIYGVKTTKIICRPGCSARMPLVKNIVLFDTMEESIQKGYRPCKRCKPKQLYQSQEESRMNIIVLFEVTVKDGKMEDYLKMAGKLKDSLANAEGFIRSERFSSLATDGKLLSMSVWENEDCVSKWRNLAAHRMAQSHGRMNDFADYKITVVTSVRAYTMTDRTEAPIDSNEYLEV